MYHYINLIQQDLNYFEFAETIEFVSNLKN